MPMLDEVTMDEFSSGLKESRTVILPCGSLEEHGSHLPLGTDTWHAVELARLVAQKIFVWVAPPVTYGLCRSSSQHPGTVSIRGTTLRLLIQDIVRGLYFNGLRNILVLSGHAGGTHIAMIIDACEELLDELEDARFAVVSINDLGRIAWKGIVETPEDSHAGEVETSIIEYLFPDKVKGRSQEEYPSFPRFLLVRNKRDFWRGGVWGNPAKASPEKGKKLLEKSVEALIDIIRSLES
ncbi:MAG: creatininase family protein [Thermodesulforhabdaceae bacterium]